MWFGVDDGVRHYDGLNWTLFTPEDGLLGTPVNVLCTASNGDVYAGSDEGISVFRGEKWERLFPRRGNYAWPVDGILETSTGELWAATGWGALHMVKGEVTLHTSLQMAEAIQVLYPDVEVVIVPEEAVPVHKWTDGTGVRVVKGAYLGIDRSEKETPYGLWHPVVLGNASV
jgi:sugar lactone lactonase YvrE